MGLRKPKEFPAISSFPSVPLLPRGIPGTIRLEDPSRHSILHGDAGAVPLLNRSRITVARQGPEGMIWISCESLYIYIIYVI